MPDNGQHLIDVHDHLRRELAQLRDMVRRVADGSLAVDGARSQINTMTMRQNNWTLGAYCASYCRVTTVHHTIEDELMFPQLRRLEERLAPVIDRLEEEHHAIAGVLERIDAALVAMVADPVRIAELRDAVEELGEALLAHLSYEESELVEPLNRLPVRF